MFTEVLWPTVTQWTQGWLAYKTTGFAENVMILTRHPSLEALDSFLRARHVPEKEFHEKHASEKDEPSPSQLLATGIVAYDGNGRSTAANLSKYLIVLDERAGARPVLALSEFRLSQLVEMPKAAEYRR